MLAHEDNQKKFEITANRERPIASCITAFSFVGATSDIERAASFERGS